jgi:hypothetical protein
MSNRSQSLSGTSFMHGGLLTAGLRSTRLHRTSLPFYVTRNVFKLPVLVPSTSVVLATTWRRHNGLPLLQLSRILGDSISPNFDEVSETLYLYGL